MPSRIIREEPNLPYRLGRHVHHDEHSRAYPFRPRRAVTPVTTSWQRRVPILDQGDLGSCTGNAAAGWLGTDDAIRQGLTELADGTLVDEDLAVALYSEATHLDPWPGEYPPDDTGSDGLSVTKALRNRGLIDGYTHGFSMDDLINATQEGPSLIGINWYGGMFDTDPDGFVTIGGYVVGGHELEVLAVNMEQEFFTLPNSWGESWGDHGYCKMRFTTVERLLHEDGDVTVPHAVAVPLPPEPVPPEPSSGCLTGTRLGRWMQRHLH